MLLKERQRILLNKQGAKIKRDMMVFNPRDNRESHVSDTTCGLQQDSMINAFNQKVECSMCFWRIGRYVTWHAISGLWLMLYYCSPGLFIIFDSDKGSTMLLSYKIIL